MGLLQAYSNVEEQSLTSNPFSLFSRSHAFIDRNFIIHSPPQECYKAVLESSNCSKLVHRVAYCVSLKKVSAL